MLNHVIYVYGFNLMYAETLVKDVSAEQMVEQPGGVINHPAWSLGHLVVSPRHRHHATQSPRPARPLA